MSIFSLVASHKNVDLSTVAHLANGASFLSENAQKNSVKGLVVLSTCNRLEIYGETDSSSASGEVDAGVIKATSQVFSQLTELSGLSLDTVSNSFETFVDESAAKHLFTVATGLESAVVGEREITGQVRRAIAQAQQAGNATGNLVRLFDRASQTAKEVGQQTLLGSRGRSVVSVALDLADDVTEGSWATRHALVYGTGAYAGATVASLKTLGCENISVYSPSGRAQTFAEKRHIAAVPSENLTEALETVDIVVGCSGSSDPLATESIPAGKLTILDLALSRDFAPEVADLPGVELITLESVRLAAPEETVEAVELARKIVDDAIEDFSSTEKARNIDAAIVALRNHTMKVLDRELEKVQKQYGCGAAAEQLELAMRRMVKSLLHTPTVRAKQLAREGREADYVSALEALYGIEVEPNSSSDEGEDTFFHADAS